MPEVTLNPIYNFRKPDLNNLHSIHISEREDGETIEKVKNLEIPTHISTTSSDGNAIAEAVQEKLEQLPMEEFEELEKIFVEKRGENYVIRLQNLVAAILAQLQQISEKDKEKINQLEKEHKVTTLSAANLQREIGWSHLKFAAISFGASFLQFLSPHESDRAIAKLFAEQVCPNFGKLWTSDLEAKLTSATNSIQMKQNKYNLLANAEQSKSSDKQQISSVFDKALRNLEAASRAN